MLIGAHVSTSGGLAKAIERGTERGCESIQVFNQSPRMWRPTKYGPNDFAAFREAMDASPVEAVVIHAVYLINCATKDKELRKKSLDSLTHALRTGDGIGADGVVLHPGAQKGEPHGPSMKRAAKVIAAALKETDRCPLLLEQTAGHKGLLGRDFDETAELIELAGAGKRLGLCLDSCHLFVQGYDVTDPERLGTVLDEADAKVGLDRLRCIHVNDAAAPLGSCRDRHANLGKGEMGKQGLAAFLSEPRFEGLPATLETPGPNKKGPDKKEVQAAKRLRRAGLKRRRERGAAVRSPDINSPRD
ncbi:MAG TPA: deoxyribonuclease IV [Solirubrobacterales bacterium]|jgi:deoxyribonuclease-4|nr:deoxyribonuclease IV [Solirubrobacterales bacterium]